VSLGLALAISGAAALVSGLLPTLWLSTDVAVALRASSRSTTSGRSTVAAQRSMVILQVSGAVVVLFAAGLLGRSLARLQGLDTGLATNRVAILELSWPEEQFRTPAQVAVLYERLLSAITAVPGVRSAAAVNVTPFTAATGGWDGRFVAEGSSTTPPVLNMAVVSASYFQTLGISLRSGRAFEDTDRTGSPPVAIVSERVAHLLWPGDNPIGKRIRFAERGSRWWTVVGVAPETRYRALRQSAPTVYLTTAQFVEVLPLIRTIAVRTHGAPGPTLAAMRRAVQQTDRAVAVLDAAELEALVDRQLATPKLAATLIAVFGAGILLLAAAGLYALLASVVRARRQELAIRQVLGATPGHLRSIVLGQSLAMCGLGLALGLAVSLAAGRYLQSVLYGVRAADGLTAVVVTVVLGSVAALASYLPASRAARPDALGLLRSE
jgi:predicted permease